jgi:hypothetical protein
MADAMNGPVPTAIGTRPKHSKSGQRPEHTPSGGGQEAGRFWPDRGFLFQSRRRRLLITARLANDGCSPRSSCGFLPRRSKNSSGRRSHHHRDCLASSVDAVASPHEAAPYLLPWKLIGQLVAGFPAFQRYKLYPWPSSYPRCSPSLI